MVGLVSKLGVDIEKFPVAAQASTFAVSYAVYKVFTPARMACTAAAAPFIVRYLRKIGILKPPKPGG